MSVEKNPSEAMSQRDELEAMLPFYLNGTLDGADLAAVEDWLSNDPAAIAALEEAEAEFSVTTASNEALRPAADALSRFSRALDAEAGPPRTASLPSSLSRLWSRFVAMPAGVAWAAAAVALALVLVQAAVGPGGRGGPVDLAGTERADLPFVLVTFKPQATLADVATFLADQGATIVSGPAPGGMFKIGIPATTDADYERIVGLIAAQPFADTVTIGRRPENGG